MEPIISPVWIYLIHVSNTVYGLSIFILLASMFMMAMSPLIADSVTDFGDKAAEKRIMLKIVKICAVFAVTCIILLILIPDKKTMYAMIAASMITPDNISSVENHVIDLISRIAEGIYNAK